MRLLRPIGRHITEILLLAFFAAFLLYPLAYVVPSSARYVEFVTVDGQRTERISWTAYFFELLFRNDFLWGCFLNSFVIAIATLVITTVISLPLAYYFSKRRFPGQTLLASLLLVPLILPPFVGALGLERVLNPYGMLNLILMRIGLMQPDAPIDWLAQGGVLGIILIGVLHLYPITYLNVAAALANVDPNLEDAARNLGASEGKVFRSVTFPLLLPGYFAGAAIIFVWSFTDLGTPLVFGFSNVVPVQIFNQISEKDTNPLGYALVVVTLLVTMLIFFLSRWFVSRGSYVMMSKGGVSAVVPQATRRETVLIYAAVLTLTFLAIVPHLGVVLMSLADRWGLTILPERYTLNSYKLVFEEPIAYLSIFNSIELSLLSTLLDVVLGVAIAYLIVRKPSRLSPLLDGLAMLPLALPGLVLAFGYLTCYNKVSLFGWNLGEYLNPVNNAVPLLVIAYTVRRLPFVTRSAMAGLQQIPPVLEEAAENLGATRWRVLRTVTVPLLTASILAGAILTFAFALLEVSDSLMLAQKEKYFPITRAIFGFWLRPDDGPYVASAMGVLGMVILTASLVAASVVLGKKMGELFRA